MKNKLDTYLDKYKNNLENITVFDDDKLRSIIYDAENQVNFNNKLKSKTKIRTIIMASIIISILTTVLLLNSSLFDSKQTKSAQKQNKTITIYNNQTNNIQQTNDLAITDNKIYAEKINNNNQQNNDTINNKIIIQLTQHNISNINDSMSVMNNDSLNSDHDFMLIKALFDSLEKCINSHSTAPSLLNVSNIPIIKLQDNVKDKATIPVYVLDTYALKNIGINYIHGNIEFTAESLYNLEDDEGNNYTFKELKDAGYPTGKQSNKQDNGILRTKEILDTYNLKYSLMPYENWNMQKSAGIYPIALYEIYSYGKQKSGNIHSSFGYAPACSQKISYRLYNKEIYSLDTLLYNYITKNLSKEFSNKNVSNNTQFILELDRDKYPLASKLIPIIIYDSISDNKVKDYATGQMIKGVSFKILWYLPTMKFLKLMPESFKSEYLDSNLAIDKLDDTKFSRDALVSQNASRGNSLKISTPSREFTIDDFDKKLSKLIYEKKLDTLKLMSVNKIQKIQEVIAKLNKGQKSTAMKIIMESNSDDDSTYSTSKRITDFYLDSMMANVNKNVYMVKILDEKISKIINSDSIYKNIDKFTIIEEELQNSGLKGDDISKAIEQAMEIDIDTTKFNSYSIFKDYLTENISDEQIDDLINKMLKKQGKNNNSDSIYKIKSFDYIELTNDELAKLGIEYNGSQCKVLSEIKVLKDDSLAIKYNLYSFLSNFGYDTTNKQLMVRNVVSVNTCSVSGDNTPVKYSGWDNYNALKTIPIGISMKSNGENNKFIKPKQTNISLAFINNSSPLFNGSLNYNNESLLDENGNPLFNLNMLVPVKVHIEGRQLSGDSILLKGEVMVWYYANQEFAELLPDKYKIPLLKELSVINDIKSGKINYQEACKGIETDGSFLNICRTTSGAILSCSANPIPIKNSATLNINLSESRSLKISLNDTYGNKIKELVSNVALNSGNQKVQLDFNDVKSGVYIINIETDKNEEVVTKVICNK